MKPFVFLFALVAGTLLLPACKKTGILEDNYPPAQVYFTNSQNILEVPGTTTPNYVADETAGKIYITLGISRSGLEGSIPFTVKVAASQDTVQQLIDEGALVNTIAMTPDMYELPAEAVIEEDAPGALIRIGVQVDKIVDLREKLALAVTISDPSAFAINPQLRTAIILVNYRKISGILHPGDEASAGRIFETFSSAQSLTGWQMYNHTTVFEGPDKIKMTQGNIDGYGITKKEGVSYNLNTYPVLAIRVYQQPTPGAWLFKSFTGSGDLAARTSTASVEEMPDNSRIYYWNMQDLTAVRGVVTGGNYQLATENANGKSLVISWIKSFESLAAVREYAAEER